MCATYQLDVHFEMDRDGIYPIRFERVTSLLEASETTRLAICWCAEQFGDPDGRDCRWTWNLNSIWFAHENDAFAFKMRWC